MAEAVHQFYATHCTYGSSALERRDGHSADRVLGYSARAGSMQTRDLSTQYGTLQRFLGYQLPADAPAEMKLELDAWSAPWRMIYHNSVAGLQVIANVCYRRWDAAEKSAGSYFAHVLVGERADGQKPWSILEALQMWRSPRWVVEDSAQIPHQLKPLPGLSEMLQEEDAPDHQPPVDDRVLHSFLTATDTDDFYAPHPAVIPPRWRAMGSEQRQSYFEAALRGYLSIASDPRRSLLLVAEPEVAVVFFYGIARVLPAGPLREALSFSTYEPNPSRLSTSLAATCFQTPAAADVNQECYEREFVINTCNGSRSEPPHESSLYADTMLAKLFADEDSCWPGVDRFLAAAEAGPPESVADLDRLAAAENISRQITTPPAAFDRQWSKDHLQEAFVRKHVLSQLEALSADHALEPFRKSPHHVLTILQLSAGQQLDKQSLNWLFRLVQMLPGGQLHRLLQMPGAAVILKLQALKRYVGRHKNFPPECDFFWDLPANETEVDRELSRIFERIIDNVDVGVLKELFGKCSEQFRESFLIKLVGVLGRKASHLTKDNDDPRLAFLAEHVRELDDNGICLLLSKVPPPDELPGCMRTAFGPPLLKMLDTLHDNCHEFRKRIDILAHNYPLVKERVDYFKVGGIGHEVKSTSRLEAWTSLFKDLQEVQQNGVRSEGNKWISRFKGDDRITSEALGEKLARRLASAVPDLLFDADEFPPSQRRICIGYVLRSMGVDRGLLPEQFDRRFEAYFADPHRRWPPPEEVAAAATAQKTSKRVKSR